MNKRQKLTALIMSLIIVSAFVPVSAQTIRQASKNAGNTLSAPAEYPPPNPPWDFKTENPLVLVNGTWVNFPDERPIFDEKSA